MHLCPHVRVPPWVQVMPRPLQQVGIPRQRVMLCRATFRHLCSAGSNKQCGAGQQRGGGVPVPGADGRRCGESGLHDGAMPRVAVPFSLALVCECACRLDVGLSRGPAMARRLPPAARPWPRVCIFWEGSWRGGKSDQGGRLMRIARLAGPAAASFATTVDEFDAGGGSARAGSTTGSVQAAVVSP